MNKGLKEQTLEVLIDCEWDRFAAARMLGITRTALVSRIRKYGLKVPRVFRTGRFDVLANRNLRRLPAGKFCVDCFWFFVHCRKEHRRRSHGRECVVEPHSFVDAKTMEMPMREPGFVVEPHCFSFVNKLLQDEIDSLKALLASR